MEIKDDDVIEIKEEEESKFWGIADYESRHCVKLDLC
jgi:hypothetical protein